MTNDIDPAEELEVRALRDDLWSFPIHDPPARASGLRTHGFALLAGAESVLVDTVCEHHRPALRRLKDEGPRPVALVLTHRHLLGVGDGLARIEEELGIPVFLHPLDAAHPRARAAEIRFHDPMDSALLSGLGVEVDHFPGHTAGHVLLRWRAHGGILFVGDCALGPTMRQARAGVERIVRPHLSVSDDDAQLRRSWESFDKPAESLLPLHGEVILDRPDLRSLLAPLRRPESTPEPAG